MGTTRVALPPRALYLQNASGIPILARRGEWHGCQPRLAARCWQCHTTSEARSSPMMTTQETSQEVLGQARTIVSAVNATLGAVDVRQAAQAGAAEALVCGIGQVVLDTNGINGIWLGDDMAEMTRQSVRDFARREVEPLATWVHRHDELAPDALITKMGALGFFAMSIPEAYGGTGMGMLVMVITTEELSRGSLGAAGSLITRPEIVARALLDGGTEAQKQRWLPRIASGELMVAVSVTEPDTGSDVAALTCRAEAA